MQSTLKMFCIGLAAAGIVSNVAVADELALATKSGCLACHSVEAKILGPAWKEVAAKYKGKRGAAKNLVEKVKKGGSGVWGTIPMTPNSPRVSDKDIATLVNWIMSLK